MEAFGFDESYGTPGPSQVTEWPSPRSHTTSAGAAVAVAETGPADAVAESGRHATEPTHNQLLTFTS